MGRCSHKHSGGLYTVLPYSKLMWAILRVLRTPYTWHHVLARTLDVDKLWLSSSLGWQLTLHIAIPCEHGSRTLEVYGGHYSTCTAPNVFEPIEKSSSRPRYDTCEFLRFLGSYTSNDYCLLRASMDARYALRAVIGRYPTKCDWHSFWTILDSLKKAVSLERMIFSVDSTFLISSRGYE